MNIVESSRCASHGLALVALHVLVVFVVLAGLPFAARAQDATQRAATQGVGPQRPGTQASPQQKAAAEVLFSEGQKLLYEKNYEAACPRFEQSQALDPGVGTLLYLAQCYDGQGRPASAWATYREAYSAARAAGQTDRAQVAEERASQLEPGLAKLTVQVAPENPRDGFELRINGKDIDAPLFGVEFPVDPGRYEIVARAFGRTPWSTSIDVQPAKRHTVEIPVLDPARDVQPLAGGDPYRSATARDGGGLADAFGALSPRQRAAVYVGVGGVTALAAGLVFGLVAKGKDDDAKEGCQGERCWTTDAAALNESARDWATGANISFIIGGLALATGGALYFWPQEKAVRAARPLPLDLSAQLGPRGGLLTVGGAL